MRRHWKTTLGLVAATAFAALLGGRLRRYEIVERSMQPALDPGDFVLAIPAGDLSRGSIVIFDRPDVDGYELVKRVVGLPGERVGIENGQVHIDQRVLAERWADGPTIPDGQWRLGPGEVFVLGDNRAISSSDSRALGPILRESIRWRVIIRYWPARTAGRVR
jgi:signal peptidase I